VEVLKNRDSKPVVGREKEDYPEPSRKEKQTAISSTLLTTGVAMEMTHCFE